MNRKVGTILSTKYGNRVTVIDYTDRVNSKEIGAFYLCPLILKKGGADLDYYVAEQVYQIVANRLGEDVSYTLDSEDF